MRDAIEIIVTLGHLFHPSGLRPLGWNKRPWVTIISIASLNLSRKRYIIFQKSCRYRIYSQTPAVRDRGIKDIWAFFLCIFFPVTCCKQPAPSICTSSSNFFWGSSENSSGAQKKDVPKFFVVEPPSIFWKKGLPKIH